MDEVIIYCDGGARGNPGHAGIGLVICDPEGNILREYGEYVGEKTNNQAEYTAIIKALELTRELTKENIKFFSDSQLVVKQLSNQWHINEERLRKLFAEVKEKEKAFKSVEYTHVRRTDSKIKMADELVNLATDRRGVVDNILFKSKQITVEKKGLEKIKEKIKKEPERWSNHYDMGITLFKKGQLEEAEKSFKSAIRLSKKPVFMPHFYLGRISFEKKNYAKAIDEFEETLRVKDDFESAKMWLEKSKISFEEQTTGFLHSQTVEEAKKVSKYPVINNYSLLEWFETSLREFIIKKLTDKYGEEEDLWMRGGIPKDVRETCYKNWIDCLYEEIKLPKLYFAEFSDYGKVIKHNRDIFGQFLDISVWKGRLDKMVKIRNAIAHSRGHILPKEQLSDVEEWCNELQKIIMKKEPEKLFEGER